MTNLELQNKIIEIANNNNLAKFADRVNDLKEDEYKISVAFLGEFSSGKSTIVNALMKKKILPMFTEPTTAVITEIQKDSENKIVVVESDDNDDEITREVSLAELAQEVTKTQTNKKIQIFRNDLNFIDKNIQIIDTPGVASINESHTDITYGYLPLVDVAFILINVNIGGTNNSLKKFLKNYPKEILDKIYFVFTWADTKEPQSLDKIKNNFKEQIADIIDDPKIITVSGKMALESLEDEKKYEESGINEVRKIIMDDVPNYKYEINKKRQNEHLKNEAQELKKLLEYQLATINWNTEELDKKIYEYENEISDIENKIRNFRNEFSKIKSDILKKTNYTIDESINSISAKIAKDEPYEEIVDAMAKEINEIIENGIKKINNLRNENLGENISQILSGSIENSTMKIKKSADLISDISTFALTAWLLPGAFSLGEAAASAGTASARTVSKTAKVAEIGSKTAKGVEEVSKFAKIGRIIGKGINELNPLEKLKIIILPFITNSKLRKKLSQQISSKLEIVFDNLELSMLELIEIQFIQPLRDKENILNNLKNDRKDIIQNIDDKLNSTKKDISEINNLLSEAK